MKQTLELAEAVSKPERFAQMQEAILRFPFLKKTQMLREERLTIVCYGPSLKDTWDKIKGPFMTVSGAHDFMVDKGLSPCYHVEIDPREHKPKMLQKPQAETQYLMASVCHPDFWHVLRNSDVKLWHLISGNDGAVEEWVKFHHPAGVDSLIGGGATVGQRALSVGAALGYRKFDIYGMDCCYQRTTHAGGHTGAHQATIPVWVKGRLFTTTPQLLQAAQGMELFLKTYDADVRFHGDGLMQTIAKIIEERKG